VVTIGECASHAEVAAAIGPLARSLYPILSEDWLLIADRNFYNWDGLVRRGGHGGGAAAAGEIGPAAAGAGAAAGRVVPVGAGQPEDPWEAAGCLDQLGPPIQSVRRPPATRPVCAISRDHAGCQPERPAATRCQAKINSS
jgi:hypothetical protein